MRIMASMVLLAVIALGVAARTGSGDGKADAGESTDIRAFAGGAYFGVVKVRVLPPEGSGVRATSRNGTGSAELQDSGRLVVVGDIDSEADAGFAADGGFAGGGWSGGSGGVELRIAPGGAISGGGTVDGNAMSIKGSIDRRRLDLFFEIELLSDSGGGFPAGTRFQFRYDLWRPFEHAPGQRGRTPEGGCREVVYRNKLVPNLSGGAMGMVRVPECRR
ncbi:hypothetical protein [Luteimonas terricola]|uniref:DUF4402 domain-containing protein n=1 Tax=Luteimonas terricola TaxID=645597 RepID=A0ABQ2E5J3_9GAMM|nr:hypothetical protein [Luteimonas terricola]GGJ96322.1 hypothetical protein GCM10011394_01400 [Luteimonas terricola]